MGKTKGAVKVAMSKNERANAQRGFNVKSSPSPNSHSTGDGRGNWDTKRIATCSIFVALSIVTSFIEIPIFPAAPFLKYDPSGIFCLLAALQFSTSTGAIVVLLPWIFRIFTDPAGAIMSLFMGLCGVLVCGNVYSKLKSNKKLFLSLFLAALASILAAMVANLIVTPLYTGVSVDTVAKMLIPIILPFNLIKFSINSTLAGIIFTRMKKVFK